MPTGLDSRLRGNDDERSWRKRWDWWDWWAEAHPTAHPTTHPTARPTAHSMPTLHICPAPASVNGECIKNAV
ncbi:TPA: hypothetical protein ACFRGQ_001243 [Neisseria lactamica]